MATELMQRALMATETMSPDMQDEAARLVLAVAGWSFDDQPLAEVSDEDQRALQAGLDAIERGEIATPDDVREVWTRHGL